VLQQFVKKNSKHTNAYAYLVTCAGASRKVINNLAIQFLGMWDA